LTVEELEERFNARKEKFEDKNKLATIRYRNWVFCNQSLQVLALCHLI